MAEGKLNADTVDVSNRQVFICHILTEKQRDLKTKNRREESFISFLVLFFPRAFL